MKIKLLAGAVILGLLSVRCASAIPALPTGPATFKLTALMDHENSVSYKTNKTATSTNVTITVKSTTSSESIVNKDVLSLLANSLTNLPGTITNGQLVTDGLGNFFVITGTSTNNVSSVLHYVRDVGVFSGTESRVVKSPPGTLTSEKETATATQVAVLTYDDSALTTGNGKHTHLTFQGLLVTKFGDKSTTSFTTSFTLTGQGDGLIEDNYVVLTGTVSGKVTGDVDLDDPS